ncbi:2-dehydro-3-deoxygalactonokinase [Providencia huaxiensis]|uniref:2-dehydro-3-deoxygalactonokinase n=1 Tax=Providencia huaxiensis TaxID=2027290 RepID=UPI0034DCE5D6
MSLTSPSDPVSMQQLAKATMPCVIKEISEKPIIFIPGVKNNVANMTFDSIESIDVMRGEEVEVFGILTQQPDLGPALVILPGSHSKFVRLDEKIMWLHWQQRWLGKFSIH